MTFLQYLLELATARRWYSEEELGAAFRDGIVAGVAFEEGTFGEEDFMSGTAAYKAYEYLEKDGGCWQDTWAYCGGFAMYYDYDFSFKAWIRPFRYKVLCWMGRDPLKRLKRERDNSAGGE